MAAKRGRPRTTPPAPPPGMVQLSEEEFAQLSRQANVAGDMEGQASEVEQSMAAADRDAEDEVLASLLEVEGASEARWQVHRVLPLEMAGFVCEMPSTELTLANIARRCGPGRYRIKGFNSRGRYVGMRTISIAQVPEKPAGNTEGTGVADVLAIIKADRDKNTENLKSWAMILVPAIAPMLPGLFQRKDTSIGELVNALTGLKGLTEAPKTSEVNPLTQFDQLAAIIERVRALIPEKESTGSTWIDLVRDGIREVGQPLTALISSRLTPQRPIPGMAPPGMGPRPALSPQPGPVAPAVSAPVASAQAPTLPAPGAAPGPAPGATPQPESDPLMTLFEWFVAQMPMLIEKAARNSDPELYAEVLLDNLPTDAQGQAVDVAAIAPWLKRPDWWALFQRVNAGVTPYQGWFTVMHKAMVELIEEALQARYLEEQQRAGNAAGVDGGGGE